MFGIYAFAKPDTPFCEKWKPVGARTVAHNTPTWARRRCFTLAYAADRGNL